MKHIYAMDTPYTTIYCPLFAMTVLTHLYRLTHADQCTGNMNCSHRQEGDCIACRCPLGFIGTNCEKQCPYPGYGEHCQMTCNCEEQYCNHTTGCQAGSPTLPPIVRSTTSSHIMSSINPTTKECSPGYTGNNCDIPCRYPSYGVSCQLECNCTEGNCHFQTGCIDHTTAEDEEKPSCNDTQSGRTMRRESLEYGVAVLGPVAVIQFSAYFCLRYLYRPAVYEINHL